MAGRKNHFSNASIFFTFLTIGIVLFLLPDRVTSRLSLSFYDTFESILQIGRDVQMDAVRLHPHQEETVSKAEYVRLWKSYKNLHAQMLSLHKEYERLANIKSGLPTSSSGWVPARTTGTTGNYSHELIINKGSDSLIRPGQFVLSENKDSLIGVINETSEATAKVRLLTDAKQTLEVRIRREGTNKDIGAIMVGNGKDGCKIPNMDRDQNIREGDTIYAAPVPGQLDVPLVAGEVVEVKPYDMDPLLLDITVQLAEDLSRVDEVAVIVADESLLLKDNK
jgi:rod shape-determining protein MreC